MSVLIAIPCYNESQRLPRFLNDLASIVQTNFSSSKILVVDDGSDLHEQNCIVNSVILLQKKFSCILNPYFLPKNVGKGGAIIAAWDRAVGYNWVAFVDADGAISASEVARLLGMLSSYSRSPVLFGSRIKMKGKTVTRSFTRHLSGRLFALAVGCLIDPCIYDSQCGLKFLPYECYQIIRPKIIERGFAFDVELLAAINAIGWPLVEVPIDWCDIPGSKVNLVIDTLKMLVALWNIKKRI